MTAMGILRQLAHLEEQLKPKRWDALISSDNTAAVVELGDQLIGERLPVVLMISGCPYERIPVLQDGETRVHGSTVVDRSKENGAIELGEETVILFLLQQDDIPAIFRGRVHFAFPGWENPDKPGFIACVHWYKRRWIMSWAEIDCMDWDQRDNLVRPLLRPTSS